MVNFVETVVPYSGKMFRKIKNILRNVKNVGRKYENKKKLKNNLSKC